MNLMLEVYGMKVAPRTRIRGTLWAGPYFFPAWNQKIRKYVPIPFSVIRGADGPTLCVIGGVHPTEYVTIAAAIRLCNDVDPTKLKGTLIIVPVVNIPGFEEREYVNPIDGKNLQGNWPGKTSYEGGTISQLILLKVFTELISKADYLLDLHGSDVHETMLPQVTLFRTGKENIDEKSESMAKATGVKYINVQSGSQGVGSLVRTLSESGTPAILFEFGTGDKILPEEVEAGFNIIINVMQHLKMLDGEPEKNKEQVLTTDIAVRVNNAGLFYPRVKLGESVLQGQVLGEIKNLFGDVIETVYAPSEGTLIYWIHNPKVEPGEEIIILLRPLSLR